MIPYEQNSSLTFSIVRKLFPALPETVIGPLAAVWDEVVHKIISRMMELRETGEPELHIDIRAEMVEELVRLQLWLAEAVVEKRVAGRHPTSIDPQDERLEVLSGEGIATIEGTAKMVFDHIWSKRLSERWVPKSAKAIERELTPKPTRLAVKPVQKNHFISRWLIRDHWAEDTRVTRWKKTPSGWKSDSPGFGKWGYRNNLYSDRLEAYFGLLEGDAKGPIDMLLGNRCLNDPQRKALVGFLVIQYLRNPQTIDAIQRRIAPAISASGYGSDPEMPRKAYETLYNDNSFYNRVAHTVMWSPWAIVRSEQPVFVLPDVFAAKVHADDGIRFIAPLTPYVCFVNLPGTETEKRIVPYTVRADARLSSRISKVLISSAASEFLSRRDFQMPAVEALSPESVLAEIVEVDRPKFLTSVFDP